VASGCLVLRQLASQMRCTCTTCAGSMRVLHAPTEDYLRAFAAAFRRLKATPEERHPTSGFTCALAALPCCLLIAKSVTWLQYRCSALCCTPPCTTPAGDTPTGTRQQTALGHGMVLLPDHNRTSHVHHVHHRSRSTCRRLQWRCWRRRARRRGRNSRRPATTGRPARRSATPCGASMCAPCQDSGFVPQHAYCDASAALGIAYMLTLSAPRRCVLPSTETARRQAVVEHGQQQELAAAQRTRSPCADKCIRVRSNAPQHTGAFDPHCCADPGVPPCARR
jgi:hypothetical protein